MSRKLFIGAHIRRIREQNSLAQNAFSQQLGISHSYLNQLENNQRPVSAAVLVKLTDKFGLDIAALAQEQGGQLVQHLMNAQQDALFASKVGRQDVLDFVESQPVLAQQFALMYDRFQRLEGEFQQLVTRFYGEQHEFKLSPLPHEEVRDFFFRHNNHIDELDRAAEDLARRLQLNLDNRMTAMEDYLQSHFDVSVVTEDISTMGNSLRIYLPERKLLKIAAQQRSHQKAFQLATTIALLKHQGDMEALCSKAALSAQAVKLTMTGLASYFAGAVLMPYRAFLQAAEQCRYDIHTLESMFGVSTEQVCHRLSTLQRKGNEGIPFYFVRVDQAGNISKRQSATSFHFAKTGGACPLWNVHEAFARPDRIVRQVAEMPDGQRYFCIALQVVSRGAAFHAIGKRFAIGLGCELHHADRLVYSDGLDLACDKSVDRIGPGCRLCPRQDCSQRAFPTAGTVINTDINVQLFNPYPGTKV